jgi:thiamine biosynthesis protein ThiC
MISCTSEKKKSSTIITPSLNPQSTFAVRINNSIGAATALYTNVDEDVCRLTIAITASRIASISTVANATGTLKFIIFVGSKPIATIPVPLAIPENSLIFTTSKLGHKDSLLITAESDATTDSNVSVVVTVNSIAPSYRGR